MVEGYDGKELIGILKGHLPAGSTLLELGMGPGKDLDILSSDYAVTGSDHSSVFLDIYRKTNPDADVLLLDALDINTDRKFDCIYSNKVLVHLTKQELKRSIKRQTDILNPGGLVFHSFWKGDRTEEMNGLIFTYYSEALLTDLFRTIYDILDISSYGEMEEEDSIYVLARKT